MPKYHMVIPALIVVLTTTMSSPIASDSLLESKSGEYLAIKYLQHFATSSRSVESSGTLRVRHISMERFFSNLSSLHLLIAIIDNCTATPTISDIDTMPRKRQPADKASYFQAYSPTKAANPIRISTIWPVALPFLLVR